MRSLCLCLLAVFVPALPGADDPPLSRIAFGSSASQEKPQPIWNAIVAAKPELFLFLGDNIYGDTDNPEILRQKYAQLGALSGFQNLVKTCPILATWDDHDYGAEDAGADFRGKAMSQKAFLEFFNEPASSPRRRREGVYVAMMFGPPGKRVQVIMLDTRYFRSPLKKAGNGYVPNNDRTATILGEAQWKWLGEQLRQPAELRLIGSSIQVVAEDHPYEKWANFPAERTRLFKLIRDTKAHGVIFLSGDRHLGELSVMDAGVGYPLYDLTSSGLNMGNRHWRPPEINRHRVATMTSGDNFGFVAIDWDAAPPTVRLQVRDGEGDIAIQQKFDLPLLTPGTLVVREPAPSAPAGKTASAITPAEAAKKVGEKVTVEFPVLATGKTRDGVRVFLNSATKRTDPDNFTVVLMMAEVGDALKAGGIGDPARYYKGKTVRVTGTVSQFQQRPQIVVEDAKAIEVID